MSRLLDWMAHEWRQRSTMPKAKGDALTLYLDFSVEMYTFHFPQVISKNLDEAFGETKRAGCRLDGDYFIWTDFAQCVI
jgi:hypothetical protein